MRPVELDRRSRTWWRALIDDLRAVAVPLLTYWAVLFVAMGLFSFLIFFDGLGGGIEALYALGSIWFSAIFGVGFGQLCAFARLRTGVVIAAGTFVGTMIFVAMTWSALTGLAVLGVPLAILWLLFPFFAVSGLLSLRTSMIQVFSLFAPMVFVTGSILYLAEASGSASRWFAGDKWAIWNLLTAPVLLLGVAMVLGYLASRERHRLHRWMTARSGPERATTQRVKGSALGAAASGCGSLVMMALLASVLTVGTGLVAPFLWRSAPSEDGEHGEQVDPDEGRTDGGEQPRPRPQPGDRDSDGDGLSDREERRHRTNPHDPDTDGDGVPDGRDHRDGRGRPGGDTQRGSSSSSGGGGGGGASSSSSGGGGGGGRSSSSSGGGGGESGSSSGGGGASDGGGGGGDGSPTEQVQEAVKQTGISLLFLLLMVLLTLLGIAVFGPPLRRTLLLQALRRPPWSVPPTRRVDHAWRLVHIALGDLGIERHPGDTAGTAVERAVGELPAGLNVEPLRMVAEIHDRVTYGLGLSPQDAEYAQRSAEMSYQAVWDILGERDKVRAVYRWDL